MLSNYYFTKNGFIYQFKIRDRNLIAQKITQSYFHMSQKYKTKKLYYLSAQEIASNNIINYTNNVKLIRNKRFAKRTIIVKKKKKIV